MPDEVLERMRSVVQETETRELSGFGRAGGGFGMHGGVRDDG